MKVVKVNKFEILKSDIKNKINFIEDQVSKLKKTDNGALDKIPDYLDAISRLEKENDDLRSERKKLDEEHSNDLEKVEGLVVELSQLMESKDA
jgi:chromosome segregation ATPase